ncbi:peroxiredoxin [Actinomycetaceae bacterium TAE3-ERU4]|nr:peroxiredoxin [Actinomycetaceae bacterium TAE3-ERU4]
MLLDIGDKAPGFSLETLTGTVTLEEMLKESKRGLVLYFYPRASTPGCTTEACDFRDNLGRLKALGYSVLAVSPDDLKAIEKFVGNHELPFLLASDPEHKVMEEYGAWGPKQNYGKTVVGTIRSTFVIDKEGCLSLCLYNVRATGHVNRLIRKLESL